MLFIICVLKMEKLSKAPATPPRWKHLFLKHPGLCRFDNNYRMKLVKELIDVYGSNPRGCAEHIEGNEDFVWFTAKNSGCESAFNGGYHSMSALGQRRKTCLDTALKLQASGMCAEV